VRAETATVTAQVRDLWRARTVEIEFRPGDPAGIDLQLDRSRLDLGDTTTATATVFDAFGNRVPGADVDFASTIAIVQRPSQTTDARGNARTLLAAQRSGSGVVRATTGPYTAVRVLMVDLWRAHLPIALR
jgi:hypothetical protein